MKRILLILAVLIGLGGGGYFYWSSGQQEKVQILKTDTARMGSVRQVLEATGIIKPQVGAIVKIGARASGTLDRVYVKVGDKVTEGQLVAEIDSRELDAQLKEAEANLRLATAKFKYASTNLPRRKVLAEKKLESQDSLDKARQDERVARFEMQAAQARLKTLKVKQSYAQIYSPMNGVVSQVTAQEGETAVSGLQVTNLITVIDPSLLEMWIYVDETDVGRAKAGQAVEFTVDAYPKKVFAGTLKTIYPEPEVRDNIVYYKVLVPVTVEQAGSLRPEMTTQCRIVVDTLDDVLVIPNRAVKWVDDEQAVFTKDSSGKVEQADVQLGASGRDYTEVKSGLSAGQEVGVKIVLPSKKKSGK
ncbi:MAG: efflux RND transporter periplasmic adaptor subunit [Desulfovibrio sp.]